MTNAIDCGNYSAVATPDQVRCLMEAGYTKAIVGTSFGTVAAAQIAAFERGGMDVEEYQFPNAVRPTARPWWLDCETDAADVATIQRLCALPEGERPTGIYTRRIWWQDNTGDWDIKGAFPWLRLWDAAYSDPPAPFVPFGGFTTRAMHQWHDSTTLCGLNVDLNIVEEEEIMDAPTKGEFGALFALTLQIGNSLNAIATAFAGHVQQAAPIGIDTITAGKMQAEIDALAAAQKAAAVALGGGGK